MLSGLINHKLLKFTLVGEHNTVAYFLYCFGAIKVGWNTFLFCWLGLRQAQTDKFQIDKFYAIWFHQP